MPISYTKEFLLDKLYEYKTITGENPTLKGMRRQGGFPTFKAYNRQNK